MMFAAAVGHRSGRATPSLRGAPQRQSMEIVRRETIYRNRNAVQTNPATSEFDKFRPSTPGLKLSRGQRGQSRFSAYATSAALRREHVGAYGIGIVESFAVRHSRDSSVSLIQCSSVQASVDIDP